MSHRPKINKILALLTTGILVTLLGALKLAGWYIKHNLYNSDKVSRTVMPELIFYVPALVLALTLLLTLLFRHWLWHVLFFLALATQAVFIYFLVDLSSAISGPSFSQLKSLIEYLDYLPFLMDFVIIIIYIIYIHKSKQ